MSGRNRLSSGVLSVWYNVNAPGCYNNRHTGSSANTQYVRIGQLLSSWFTYSPMGFFHETSDSCSAFKAPCSLNSTIHQRCGDGKKDAWAHLGISFSNSLTCFDTVEHGTTSHYWAIQYAISARIPDFLATSNAPGRDSILRVITLV